MQCHSFCRVLAASFLLMQLVASEEQAHAYAEFLRKKKFDGQVSMLTEFLWARRDRFTNKRRFKMVVRRGLRKVIFDV